MIEREQVRAARALLGWSQSDLSNRSGIGRRTLMNFENGLTHPMDVTLQRIEEVLKAAGVQMTRSRDGSIGVLLSYESFLEGRARRHIEHLGSDGE
ncbi:helix-turn-helix domain-containing protein [Methylobacterium sp. J-090]|uniref:helix-turn-helix domain-containing protein n=1 Tax=Methylobacterium sp. J-090 TaxID=2836666 RepID=UPI00391AB3D6